MADRETGAGDATQDTTTDVDATDQTTEDANPSDDGGTDRAVIDEITPDDPSTTSDAVRAPSESTGEQPLPAVPDEATMVTLRIRRFDAGSGEEARWDSFSVPALPTDRLLNLMHYVKWYLDGTLTFRRSCAHGVCGSDAMRINGVNRLACKVLMRDMLAKGSDTTITIEPIRGLPVEKDLLVDMEPFFDAYRAVKPFLMTSGNEPTRERIQSAADRQRFDDTTKCILCACCTTSCPVYWSDGSYFGPAAIVNAHRFIFDSRDEGAQERLDILNDKEGVWRCRTTFNCTDACPRGIEVTKAIQEVKRALLFSR